MLFQLRKGRRWEADKEHRTGERLAKDGERLGERWGELVRSERWNQLKHVL